MSVIDEHIPPADSVQQDETTLRKNNAPKAMKIAKRIA